MRLLEKGFAPTQPRGKIRLRTECETRLHRASHSPGATILTTNRGTFDQRPSFRTPVNVVNALAQVRPVSSWSSAFGPYFVRVISLSGFTRLFNRLFNAAIHRTRISAGECHLGSQLPDQMS